MAHPAPRPPQSPEAFDTLYREHVDLVYRYAYRLCGEAETAKDLVQETFLNAYRGLQQFRSDAKISTWLYTIASRACLRMRRKRKGAPERELSLEEFVPTSEGEFRLQIPIEGLTPQQALENKELREALDHAINKLSKKYRMTLVLRDMEGLSTDEAAAIMGLTARAPSSGAAGRQTRAERPWNRRRRSALPRDRGAHVKRWSASVAWAAMLGQLL